MTFILELESEKNVISSNINAQLESLKQVISKLYQYVFIIIIYFQIRAHFPFKNTEKLQILCIRLLLFTNKLYLFDPESYKLPLQIC